MSERRKKKHTEPVEPNWKAIDEKFRRSVNAAEVDLLTDLNDAFFAHCYELVQMLLPVSKVLALNMKCFVDLLFRLHSRYVSEVQASQAMEATVREARNKLELALESTEVSASLMDKLRGSVEEAWRVADALDLRVLTNSEGNSARVSKVKSMDSLKGDHFDVKELHMRSVVYRERDRLARELEDYQRRLETHRIYSTAVERQVDEKNEMIVKQRVRLQQMAVDLFNVEHNNLKTFEAFEDGLNEKRKEILSLTNTVNELRPLEAKYHESVTTIGKLKRIIEKMSHQNYLLHKENHMREAEHRHDVTLVKNVKQSHKILMAEKEMLERELRTLHTEIKEKTEVHAQLNRRFLQLTKKNADLSSQHLELTNKVLLLEKNLAVTTGKLNEMVRLKEDGERNHKKLMQELNTQTDNVAALRHDLTVQKHRTQDVQLELDRAHKSMDEKDYVMHKMKREMADLVQEVNDLNKKIETLEGTVTEKSEKIANLKEQLACKQKIYQKIRQQLEMLHGQKTMIEKNLMMCGRERQSYRTLNAKLGFQINQLCNQLASNEKEMNSKNRKIDQLDSLVKHKMTEMHQKENQLRLIRTDLKELKLRNENLQCTIERDDKRFKEFSLFLDEAVKEKVMVGEQIVRRNGELRVQHEKISMMRLALERGTTQYNQRLEDIRLLKSEIRNLHMSNSCMQRAINTTADMRQKLVNLERQLLRERLHVAAFMEEMKYPYRIHRWRVLIGRDPTKYQLIRKVQLLVKANIRLNVQRMNLESKVTDTQKQYDLIKRKLLHMPDPEVEKRLWLQQRINEKQSRKLRAMKAELTINEIDMKSRDLIITEFQDVLKKEHQGKPLTQKAQQHSSGMVSTLFRIIAKPGYDNGCGSTTSIS